MALENQASSDRAVYRIPVQITESGHVNLARVRWFTSSEVGAAISLKSIWRGRDRCRLWLWPQAALRNTLQLARIVSELRTGGMTIADQDLAHVCGYSSAGISFPAASTS